MELRAFKKAVIRLNTENAEIVRDYYLNLEEAMFAYGEYTMNFLMEKTERQRKLRDSELATAIEQLTIKDKSEEELHLQLTKLESQLEEQRLCATRTEKETKEKLQRALKFNQATKQVEPREYIYIATTEVYSLESKFKPGGCSTFDLVKSRLSQYNVSINPRWRYKY
jgi:ribosomal protein L16 Arg81 hydroxylase